jgi:hypothetical protein
MIDKYPNILINLNQYIFVEKNNFICIIKYLNLRIIVT